MKNKTNYSIQGQRMGKSQYADITLTAMLKTMTEGETIALAGPTEIRTYKLEKIEKLPRKPKEPRKIIIDELLPELECPLCFTTDVQNHWTKKLCNKCGHKWES